MYIFLAIVAYVIIAYGLGLLLEIKCGFQPEEVPYGIGAVWPITLPLLMLFGIIIFISYLLEVHIEPYHRRLVNYLTRDSR